jgi:curved DNA-binding protein CbpA
MAPNDPYKVLGVPRDADNTTIKKAYKNLAMKLHPDKIGSNMRALDQMKIVNEAYAILMNKNARTILEDDDDWKGSASEETKERVWKEYSKQVEEYYRQVQSYLETELSSIQKEREKLSGIEQALMKREDELKKKETDLVERFRKREEHISRKESELDELLMLISRSNSIIVDLVQTSKSLRNNR